MVLALPRLPRGNRGRPPSRRCLAGHGATPDPVFGSGGPAAGVNRAGWHVADLGQVVGAAVLGAAVVVRGVVVLCGVVVLSAAAGGAGIRGRRVGGGDGRERKAERDGCADSC